VAFKVAEQEAWELEWLRAETLRIEHEAAEETRQLGLGFVQARERSVIESGARRMEEAEEAFARCVWEQEEARLAVIAIANAVSVEAEADREAPAEVERNAVALLGGFAARVLATGAPTMEVPLREEQDRQKEASPALAQKPCGATVICGPLEES